MSAVRKSQPKRPPTFSTYVDVDVDIDPEDLEAAGWVYVGKGKDDTPQQPPSESRVLSVVKQWHDDYHDGPWRWCRHIVCDDLRRDDFGSAEGR